MSAFFAFIAIIQLLIIKPIYSQSKKPNWVFLFADDLGFNDVGWRGASNIYTPNLDNLRNTEALEFEHFYVTPKCSPTRSSFMTGRYTYKIGMQHDVGILAYFTCGLDPSIKNTFFGERLKTCAGYNNYYLGKWHLGEYKWAYTPIYRGGLDYFKGYLNSHIDYFNFTYEVNDDKLDSNYSAFYDWRINTDIYWDENDEDYYTTFAFGDGAIEIIEDIGQNNDDTPFSLIVSFEAPHTPLHEAPEPFWSNITDGGDIGPGGPFGDESDTYYDDRRQYISMVYVMDYYIGEIIDALKTQTVNGESIWDNTWFFFFSDNGGIITSASMYPLRGAKATNWEGGIRVPALLSGGLLPQNKKGKQFDGLVHITDLYATVMDYTNISTSDLKLDGETLRTLIEGPGDPKFMEHTRDRFIITADSVNCDAEYNGKEVCGGIIRDFDKDNDSSTSGVWKLVIGTEALTGTQGKFFWGELENQDDINQYANQTLGLERQIVCDPKNKGYVVPTVNNAFKNSDCGINNEPCLYKISEDPCEIENRADDSPKYLTPLMTALQVAYDSAVTPFWDRDACDEADQEDVYDYITSVGYFVPFAQWFLDDPSVNKSNTPIYGGVCAPTQSPTINPTEQPTTDEPTTQQPTEDPIFYDLSTTNIETTDMATSDMATSDMTTSDMAMTDMATTDMASTDMETSDMAITDMAMTDMATSDMATTDMATSDQVTVDESTTKIIDATDDISSTETIPDNATRVGIISVLFCLSFNLLVFI